MKGNITKEQLAQLSINQEHCKNEGPVTTIATFKLSELEELIASIKKKTPKIEHWQEDNTHYVCIRLVRQKMQDEFPYDSRHKQSLKKYENEKQCTQMFPIITGCIGKLGANYGYEDGSFEYLTNTDGTIEFLRPGGEGTGLIPPPPPGGGKGGGL